MKKSVLVIMIISCLALATVVVLIKMAEDTTGPEFVMEEVSLTYTEGDSHDDLIVGISAVDKSDGDVSESIRVEGVYSDVYSSTAKVIYVAKDSKNNISKATRVVEYVPNDGSTEAFGRQDETAIEGDPEQIGEELGLDELQDGDGVDIPAITETPELASPESPVLTLTETTVTVARGAAINRIAYVQDIFDDKDSREELFRNIQISGDINTAVVGSYTLIYHVVDSDGNRSNDAELTVIVE